MICMLGGVCNETLDNEDTYLPELCMQDLICDLICKSEPESIQVSINITTTAMEMPATMKIFHSNHFAKSKDGS